MLKCGSVVKEHFSIATLAYHKDGRCYPLQCCTFIWVLSCHTKVSWYDMFFLTGLIVMETLRYVLLKFQFIQKSNVGVSKKCYVIFMLQSMARSKHVNINIFIIESTVPHALEED